MKNFNNEINFNYTEIEKIIGYEFNDKHLLLQAFVRSSYAEEHPEFEDNEVLEFIGDSVLSTIVVKKLINRYRYKKSPRTYTLAYILGEKEYDGPWFKTTINEAALSTCKIKLVKSQTLADAISKLHLQNYLIMGAGDVINNVQEQQSVKEDLCESIIGAVTIDCNWDMNIITGVVDKVLAPDTFIASGYRDSTDYKSLVIKWYADNYDGEVLDITAEIDQSDEYQQYTCSIFLGHRLANEIVTGHGTTKEGTEYITAEEAYHKIQEVTERKEKIIAAVGEPDFERAINQLHELWQKGIIPEPIYEFNERNDLSNNGNPQWECSCTIGKLTDDTGVIDVSKKVAKKYAAYEALVNIMGIFIPFDDATKIEETVTEEK